jgi:hypothetical protein
LIPIGARCFGDLDGVHYHNRTIAESQYRCRRERLDGWGSTTKIGVRSDDSSRPEQSPLPTLAGFAFIDENVASHDGPLSTFGARRETAGVSDNLTWRTRRIACPFN